MTLFFQRTITFELLDLDELEEDERRAVLEALAEQEQGVNAKFQVGAVAYSYDGTWVSVRNDTPGPDWHAEQRALCNLYAKSKDRRLKFIAMAGARPGEPVVRRDLPLHCKGVNFEDICWAKPCGKCLEFIHDCTANVPDVGILSVAQTSQVVRTSLRTLLTAPHTSMRVPVKNIGGEAPSAVWHPVPSTSENKHDPHG
jgi:cytidine deaminase